MRTIVQQNRSTAREISRDFYENYYEAVFNTSGIVGWGYRKTHRAVESLASKGFGQEILEIGAGTGEHLPFVNPEFAKYTMLDLSPEPEQPSWQEDDRVSWISADAALANFDDESFDRIISMCVLHHLGDPTTVFANVHRWLRPGGTFSFFLPSDPGFMNRLNRRLFVTPKARKAGFEHYEYFNAIEHRNHYWGLREMLMHEFHGCEIRTSYWPFRIPIGDLSLYSIWHITKLE